MTIIPVTSEFAIAVSSGSNGPSPTMTTLADGRILVSWYDIGSTSGDIRHRILDVDGTPLTGEIITPATTTGNQVDQSVAALTGGGFVVVWEDYSTDGFGNVHFRVYDGAGNAVSTGIVTAGGSADDNQRDPVVIGTADGGFVVAWSDDAAANTGLAANSGALVARSYSATGVAQSDIVRISGPNGSSINPAIDADANGVVYVWDDNAQNGIYTSQVPTGIPPADQTGDGSAVTSGPESSFAPDVAITAAGTVFVWEDFVQDEVWIQIGSGAEQRLLVTSASQENVRVDALAFGGFVVVWEQFNSGTSSDIMCQVFDTNGAPIGSAVNLTAGQTGAEFDPDVTGLIDGRFMVTWSSQGTLGDVVGRIYDPRTERVAWTGGDLGERFVGTDLADQGDQLYGGGGNDSIAGQAGNDIISGDTGNDVLDGGAGNDFLTGGTGNDTYIVTSGDTVKELSGDGTDTVQTTGNFTLGANIENLVIIGSSAGNITGNSGANTLTGNSGANSLNGGGGSDRLIGGAGNDTYVTDGGDTITENSGQGTDTVRASVTFTLGANLENLVLTGSSAINGTGNSAVNSLTGNSAKNSLNGGGGSDTLAGGSGADHFIFNSALGTSNIDRITDYNVAADTIRIDNAVFTGLSGGALKAVAFAKNTSGNAADASDRIIYESDTGKLYFDRDGTGSAAKVHFATLNKNLALTNADFIVF